MPSDAGVVAFRCAINEHLKDEAAFTITSWWRERQASTRILPSIQESPPMSTASLHCAGNQVELHNASDALVDFDYMIYRIDYLMYWILSTSNIRTLKGYVFVDSFKHVDRAGLLSLQKIQDDCRFSRLVGRRR